MKRFIFVLIISLSTLSLTGCNDLLTKLSNLFNSEQPKPHDIHQQNLKKDLKAFDAIRTQQNSVFFELNEKLESAKNKETSTATIRADLISFSDTLASQTESFKGLHLHTTEVAKMRNKVMQLNYSTIQIIQVVDNPTAVNKRMNDYLNVQKKLINDYNKLRTEAELKL